MTVLSADKNGIQEEEKNAVCNIKRWVSMICRNRCSDENKIFISPYSFQTTQGETIQKTIICISENLPEGPVIQIPKPITDICIEDLLSCYKLINYCKKTDVIEEA